MTVLITRPTLDAQETARFLEKNNIKTLIDPMILVEPLDDIQIDLTAFKHIIFTSKNGIRAFTEKTSNRDLTAWCVGDETTDLAKTSGFKEVHSASGTAQDLQNMIIENIEKEPVLRIWRTDQEDIFSDALTGHGHDVTSLALYRPTPAKALSNATITALKKGEIEHLLLFSPQTANVTAENIQAAGLRDACRTITVWCISKKTADALTPIHFKEVVIADAPNQKDLLTPLIARTKIT